MKKVRALPKAISKVRRAGDTIGETISVGELAHLVGILFFVSSAIRNWLGPFYFAMKFYRRVASRLTHEQVEEETRISIPHSVQRQLRQWVSLALQNKWTTPPKGNLNREFTLYSDASLSGWGAILVRETDGRVFATGGRWPPLLAQRDINTLESCAVLEASFAFRSLIEGANVAIRVDNTSCAFALRRGYARALFLNAITGKIVENLEKINVQITDVRYVRSAANPSDAVSRGARTVDQEEVLNTHRALDAHYASLATGYHRRRGRAGRRQRADRLSK